MMRRPPRSTLSSSSAASDVYKRQHQGYHRTYGTLREINAGKCLIDLECPRLTRLGVNMVPVIQAKRHVTVLLNLEHHDVTTQCVNRSSRKEDTVAGLWSEVYEVVCHRPVCERPL